MRIRDILEDYEIRDTESKSNLKKQLTYGIKFPLDMPKKLQDIILSWDVITQSPYSYSYYDITNKSWDDNPNMIFYRVADHWNFSSQGEIHCRTLTPVPDNCWALAIHTPKGYKVIKTYQKLSKNDKEYKQNEKKHKTINDKVSSSVFQKNLDNVSDDIKEFMKHNDIKILNKNNTLDKNIIKYNKGLWFNSDPTTSPYLVVTKHQIEDGQFRSFYNMFAASKEDIFNLLNTPKTKNDTLIYILTKHAKKLLS